MRFESGVRAWCGAAVRAIIRIQRRATSGLPVIRITSVLCPVDLSEPSRHALDHAVAVTKWCEAKLVVLHVFRAFPIPIAVDAVALSPEPIAIEPDRILDDVGRFCAPSLGALESPPRIVVKEGDAEHEIIAQAEQLSADLIVMGTHGRKGIQRLLLGSVTERVLRTTRVPVITVPPAERAEPVMYEKVLCPIEFHESEPRALEHVLSLVLPFLKGVAPHTKKSGARLILLHVVEGFFEQLPEYFSIRERHAMKRLTRAVPADARDWCRPEARVTAGKADTEILRAAADVGADLIVMAVHGKGAADRRLYRSTTSHVIRDANCPVLTLCAE
jgi:nucleotide-binding universal stress UspA family protein